MKSMIFIALLASFIITGVALAESATISFNGTINGPTCSLTTSNITIPIGDIKKSVFSGVNSTSPWSPNVGFISGGCNAYLVSMTFTGTPDPNNPNLFAVTGGAKGVGIQLAKAGGTQQAIPNSPTPVTFAAQPSGGTYSFAARYMQTLDNITTGPGNATITVLLTYT